MCSLEEEVGKEVRALRNGPCKDGRTRGAEHKAVEELDPLLRSRERQLPLENHRRIHIHQHLMYTHWCFIQVITMTYQYYVMTTVAVMT